MAAISKCWIHLAPYSYSAKISCNNYHSNDTNIIKSFSNGKQSIADNENFYRLGSTYT